MKMKLAGLAVALIAGLTMTAVANAAVEKATLKVLPTAEAGATTQVVEVTTMSPMVAGTIYSLDNGTNVIMLKKGDDAAVRDALTRAGFVVTATNHTTYNGKDVVAKPHHMAATEDHLFFTPPGSLTEAQADELAKFLAGKGYAVNKVDLMSLRHK